MSDHERPDYPVYPWRTVDEIEDWQYDVVIDGVEYGDDSWYECWQPETKLIVDKETGETVEATLDFDEGALVLTWNDGRRVLVPWQMLLAARCSLGNGVFVPKPYVGGRDRPTEGES